MGLAIPYQIEALQDRLLFRRQIKDAVDVPKAFRIEGGIGQAHLCLFYEDFVGFVGVATRLQLGRQLIAQGQQIMGIHLGIGQFGGGERTLAPVRLLEALAGADTVELLQQAGQSHL